MDYDCLRSHRLNLGCTNNLSSKLFSLVDVVTEFAREGALSEFLHNDDDDDDNDDDDDECDNRETQKYVLEMEGVL